MSEVRSAADFLRPLAASGAPTAAKRLDKAISLYGPQIGEGLAAGGPDGAAKAFIGLDRIKRVVGRGIDSREKDIHAASLETFMRIRQILEDDLLWGKPAAASQRAQNEAWVAKITADKAGYRGKFLRSSPTERRVERMDIEGVDDAQTKPLDVGDVAQMEGLVNKLGTEGGDETMAFQGPMLPGEQRPVYGVTDVDRFKAGVRSRADLAGTLAREFDAPPDIMAEADAARRFAYGLDQTLDDATREQTARRALEGVEGAHRTFQLADLVPYSSKIVPHPGSTARSMAAIERQAARNPPKPVASVPGPPQKAPIASLSRSAVARHAGESAGGMSLSPADALAMLEQDPNAFGPRSQAIRAAAERNDLRAMNLAMLARTE